MNSKQIVYLAAGLLLVCWSLGMVSGAAPVITINSHTNSTIGTTAETFNITLDKLGV